MLIPAPLFLHFTVYNTIYGLFALCISYFQLSGSVIDSRSQHIFSNFCSVGKTEDTSENPGSISLLQGCSEILDSAYKKKIFTICNT